MKKLICTLSIFCIFVLSACSVQDNTKETFSEKENTLISSSSMTSSDSTSQTNEDDTSKATVETNVVSNTEIENADTVSSEISVTTTYENKPEENTEKAAEVSSIPIKEEPTSSMAQPQNTETTSAITEPETEPKATEKDAEIIAQKLVDYINVYRNNEGVQSANILLGLTKYAEYRSKQLVTNFAHDTIDERAAATALQYGEYIEPSIYGMTGEPYYTANAREAIAKTNYGGTIEQVATHLAKLTYNSKSHWSYVGGEKYNYIAVGITYDQGRWYCCIAMKRENTHEN
ncbi:MAG: hypothetical protein IJZ75_00455 [Clostridia bacterium]|nr:hypothetical protein [Clostridia bacterium]